MSRHKVWLVTCNHEHYVIKVMVGIGGQVGVLSTIGSITVFLVINCFDVVGLATIPTFQLVFVNFL